MLDCTSRVWALVHRLVRTTSVVVVVVESVVVLSADGPVEMTASSEDFPNCGAGMKVDAIGSVRR